MLLKRSLAAALLIAMMLAESQAQVIPDASGDSKGSDRYGMVSRTDSAGEWWDRLGLPIPFGPDLIFADSFEAAGGGCTIGNWDVSSGITEADADVQSPTHRRFSGPCGLRVPVLSGNPAFLRNSLDVEGSLRVRFYAFFDQVSGEVAVLSGLQFSKPQFDVIYNFPTPDDLTLAVAVASDNFVDLTIPDIGPGWHGVEIEWQGAVSAPIALRVDGVEVLQVLDTTKRSIDEIQFGVPFSQGTASGTIHLDAYKSRRATLPGLLLKGDSNDDGIINVQDLVSVVREVDLGEFDIGQPDCNADGSIDSLDYQCLLDIISTQ